MYWSLSLARYLYFGSIATACLLLVLGCESSTQADDQVIMAQDPGRRHNRFAVRWVLASDQTGAIAAAMEDLEPIPPREMPGLSALTQMGMQIRRIPSQSGAVQEMVRALEPLAADVTTWHGDIYQWRSLLVVAIGPAPRAVAIDGQMMTLPAGVLSLDGRAWPLLTEDGDQLYLEMVPVFKGQSQLQRASAGKKTRQARVFESAEIRLLLHAGDAYVISSICADQTHLATVAGPVDPLDAHGEEQWTLGELLFTRDLPEDGRGLLILLPWGAGQSGS